MSHQVFVDAAEDVGVQVSLAEVLEHGDGVEARLRAVDRDVAVAAVHPLHAAWLRHAVADAQLVLLFLLLMQQRLACPSALLDVAVRVGISPLRVGRQVLARLAIQHVAELACRTANTPGRRATRHLAYPLIFTDRPV